MEVPDLGSAETANVDGLVQLLSGQHGGGTVSYTHLDVYKRQGKAVIDRKDEGKSSLPSGMLPSSLISTARKIYQYTI